MQVKHCEGLLRSHGKKPAGKKKELHIQVESLLEEKTSQNSDMTACVREMLLRVDTATAATQLTDRPLAPTSALEAAPAAAREAAPAAAAAC